MHVNKRDKTVETDTENKKIKGKFKLQEKTERKASGQGTGAEGEPSTMSTQVNSDPITVLH